jgi:bacterioferritin
MDKAKLIQKLNQAVALEWGAVLQYNQYAQVLLGEPRKIWEDFFSEASNESLEHARKFGSRIVALGGIPTAEPEAIRQTSDLREMLTNSLELERRAVQVYTEALEFCQDSPAYRNLLEEQIWQETEDVEELEKYLNQISKVAAAPAGKRAAKSA